MAACPQRVLNEFCEGYFGERLSSMMKENYLLLDKAPLVSRLLPKVEIVNLLGTEKYEHEARKALKRAKAVAIDPCSKPRFPLIVEPREMRAFVIRRLEWTITVSQRLRQFHARADPSGISVARVR